MKIVAIIPARGGSKGVPNKNIRMLAGHPLIYYSINNALKSKYIDEVIVSTDSEEIASVSRNLGAKIHFRDESLARDNVSLSPVIYDAIRDIETDFIVTMQATSPCLTVETLDKAIETAINSEYDTIISVCNHPNLAWRRQDEQFTPEYEARLNRQQLPGRYVETGAFFISKASAVTKDSHIGKNCSCFEIPETEAIDIDDFSDILLAEYFLRREKIAIFVNGNLEMGLGHIYRSFDIADSLYVKPDIYYLKGITETEAFGDTTHNLIQIKDLEEFYQKIKENKYTTLITDNLDTELEYMKSVREMLPKAKLINFEDKNEGHGLADHTINSFFDTKKYIGTLNGSKYYFARKAYLSFKPINIREKVEDVLILFGGADPQNYTEKLLKIISASKYDKIHFRIIVGRSNAEFKNSKAKTNSNIEIIYNTKILPELIQKSDIAISSCGNTAYEFALLGIPTIAIAENLREEDHEFIRATNGFNYLGINPDEKTIERELDKFINLSQEERQNIHNKQLSTDLISGRERILRIINYE